MEKLEILDVKIFTKYSRDNSQKDIATVKKVTDKKKNWIV